MGMGRFHSSRTLVRFDWLSQAGLGSHMKQALNVLLMAQLDILETGY